MDQALRRKHSFLLRLPATLREHAARLAQDEGTSLNQFIGLALAEKISRTESKAQQSGLMPVSWGSPAAHRGQGASGEGAWRVS